MCASPTRACASARRPRKTATSTSPRSSSACEITGADAVHPGYGFLSENARFAEILADHDVQFIGPKAEHIRMMGDKIEAKRTAKRLGIPVVPGSDGGVTTDAEATKIADGIGYPGADQGGGRRRRPRHEGRAHAPPNCRPRCRPRAPRPRPRSATTPSIIEKYLEQPAPHRNPGAGRRQRQRHPSRRARLLAAAPASEGAGGKPLARAQHRARATRSARRSPRPCATWPISASAPSSFFTRTASSISSR